MANEDPYLMDKDIMFDGVVGINNNQHVNSFNSYAEQITGFKAKEVIGQKISFLYSGDEPLRVLSTGHPMCNLKMEFEGVNFLVDILPVIDKDKVIGAIIIMRNIVQFESIIKELQQICDRNRELENILDSFYDGIGIIDEKGVLLRVNSSYERITGLSPERNNVGRNVRDLQEEGSVSRAVALMVLDQKKPITIKQEINTGKEVLITGSPIFNDDGEVMRVVCNIRDMNELKILNELADSKKYETSRFCSELKELRVKQLSFGDIVVRSEIMRQVFGLATRVAAVDSNVVITGESGVGKGIIAKVIHKSSPRADGPFLQINCGAIPENLLESELFGYEDGAFTGARKGGKMGYFEICNGGTLLLDEVAELPLSLQVKLLRVIQERELFRIGGTTSHKFDVRIIAATNKNLGQMVEDGTFRVDLFYRLNVIPINVPALRERPLDIIPLAIYFLEKFNGRFKTSKRFDPEVLQSFESYYWAGNVREMENLVERLIVTTAENVIHMKHLPDCYKQLSKDDDEGCGVRVEVKKPIPLKEAVGILEKELLEKSLQLFGSTRRVGKVLNVSHPTVIRKAKKYNLS